MDFDSQNSAYDVLSEKWDPVLQHPDLPVIEDSYKRKVTACLLENQEKALREQHLHEFTAPTNQMGAGGFSVSAAAGDASNNALAGYDPILISLVRRAMPNLMAYDLAGVQPMSAPTGLIFAMRARYDSQAGTEALYQEAFSKFSGEGATSTGAATAAHVGMDPTSASLTDFRAMLTATAEGLGQTDATGANQFREMAFSIERVAVEAKTRALKAEYTTELAQDLKAVHGLDAETELANILSTEILAEINRELVRTIYTSATSGSQQSDLSNGGTYDLNTDSDGRWSAERFRGLMFQIEREANLIAKETRRGKGNIVICSSDVASALSMSGILNHDPAFGNLTVDDTGNTFVGVLNGRTKVYVDPYSTTNYICVGYRGESQYDAGIFYCPYVPLQMVRAVDASTFQPKIGFKTRYGMVENPFSRGTTAASDGVGTRRENKYYRIFAVDNLHGIGYDGSVQA